MTKSVPKSPTSAPTVAESPAAAFSSASAVAESPAAAFSPAHAEAVNTSGDEAPLSHFLVMALGMKVWHREAVEVIPQKAVLIGFTDHLARSLLGTAMVVVDPPCVEDRTEGLPSRWHCVGASKELFATCYDYRTGGLA